MPQLSLAAIARSIFEPHRPAENQQKVELDALQMLRQTLPVLARALEQGFQEGLLNDEQVEDIRKAAGDVWAAFVDLTNRQRKLGETYDIRREGDARLKVCATNSVAAFNEHLSQIAELASRLRDGGYLEEAEFLALLDMQELLRRCSREILVAS
jgi:hypothetical protein